MKFGTKEFSSEAEARGYVDALINKTRPDGKQLATDDFFIMQDLVTFHPKSKEAKKYKIKAISVSRKKDVFKRFRDEDGYFFKIEYEVRDKAFFFKGKDCLDGYFCSSQTRLV